MYDILSNPGMATVLMIVLIVHGLSVAMLGINLSLFRSQRRKYATLYTLVGGNVTTWGTPGRMLVPLYIVLTIMITVSTTYFFLFQPHFL